MAKFHKYQDKYRIPSTRLQQWDYRWAGVYYITICTKERQYFFGEIENGKMILTPTGFLANKIWIEIENHHDNVELGTFVIMPNHIHGIIILKDSIQNNIETGHALSPTKSSELTNGNKQFKELRYAPFQTNEDNLTTETGHALSLQKDNKNIGQERFQNIGKNSIFSIIGSYKSAVSKHAHRLGFEFQWHTRYYDHIIRDEISYNKISEYILNNILNWDIDEFYQNEHPT